MKVALLCSLALLLVLYTCVDASTTDHRSSSFRHLVARHRDRQRATTNFSPVPSDCRGAAGSVVSQEACMTLTQVIANTRADFTGQKSSCAILFPSAPNRELCEANNNFVLYGWAVHIMARPHDPKPQHCGVKCKTLEKLQELVKCPTESSGAATCAAARITWCLNTDCKFVRVAGQIITDFPRYNGLVMRGDGRKEVLQNLLESWFSNGIPPSKEIKNKLAGSASTFDGAMDVDDHIESNTNAGFFTSTSKATIGAIHARGWACDKNKKGVVAFFCATDDASSPCSRNVDSHALFTEWNKKHTVVSEQVRLAPVNNARKDMEVTFVGGIPSQCICGWRQCTNDKDTVEWFGKYTENYNPVHSSCTSICASAKDIAKA